MYIHNLKRIKKKTVKIIRSLEDTPFKENISKC